VGQDGHDVVGRSEVVDEAPRADLRKVPMRKGAPHVQSTETTQRHLTRLDETVFHGTEPIEGSGEEALSKPLDDLRLSS
jgi:hypothetical protein